MLWRAHAGSGRAIVSSEYVALGGQSPLCRNRSVADWDVICTKIWGAVSESESIAKPHRYCYYQRKGNSSWTTYSSISYRKFISIIVLSEHLLICGWYWPKHHYVSRDRSYFFTHLFLCVSLEVKFMKTKSHQTYSFLYLQHFQECLGYYKYSEKYLLNKWMNEYL